MFEAAAAHDEKKSSLLLTSPDLSLKGALPNDSAATSANLKYKTTSTTLKEVEHVESGKDDAVVVVGSKSKQPLDGVASSASTSSLLLDSTSKVHSNSRINGPVNINNGQPSYGNEAFKTVNPGSTLGTEIAVDWLNNLLFVLDKYRLFVVDFDGNNELVLIDDFNSNNRPVDIKVDPVNDFLFWLQMGKFHNTIYKLDLNVLSMPTDNERSIANTLKASTTANRYVSKNAPTNQYASELVALISHHYAHPIITNLPKHVKLFTIDHKNSRIYVPLAPSSTNAAANTDDANSEKNHTLREETEVFGNQQTDSVRVTHMNSTSNHNTMNELSMSVPYAVGSERNCTTNDSGQILAFNLDGTDVGPLRSGEEKSHLSGLADMEDITLDSDNNYLYWLTNNGKELFEEYKNDKDTAFYSAQHNLDGKSYLKLQHFDSGSNQPKNVKPRFNLRKLIHVLSASSSGNRLTRSDLQERIYEEKNFPSYNGKRHSSLEVELSQVSRNTPYIILGITSLIVISVYLIYALVFQQHRSSSNVGSSREGSIGGSFLAESHVDEVVNGNGFIGVGSNTISKWIAPRSTDTSTFDRSCVNDPSESCYLESTNGTATNAIDEHYRARSNQNPTIDFDLESNLAMLSKWPNNTNDMSNKLYVPIEVLNDEALASIHRVALDQLEIDKHKSPLGEGHFGIVLQGKVICKASEKTFFNHNNKSCLQPVSINVSQTHEPQSALHHQQQPVENLVASSSSSGHGSSSTSSDFITATSGQEVTTGDYMTPKSQCNSAIGDFIVENPTTPAPDSCSSYYNTNPSSTNQDDLKTPTQKPVETKLSVAIKKLKDNASAEEKRDFLQEAKLLASFDHPNIVQLIGICLDRGSTLIVMELMLGGDLIRYMRSESESLNQEDLFTICMDIVEGCCYLEELNYIHRDLAARNCLVSSRKRRERVVKLADFGLARDIYKDEYYRKTNDSAMPLKWMAPECVTEHKFTTMSDVWSFGVVMWEVMGYCREKPYAACEPCLVLSQLTSGLRLAKPENCHDEIYQLMMSCWNLNPEHRPTFRRCKNILQDIRRRVD